MAADGAAERSQPCARPADEPARPRRRHDACQSPNNHILGPRSGDRPLPLLAGDAAHGFHPACAVPWATLSPTNQPLPVVGCFRGSLLQLDNDAACGHGTGRLWVSSRWVLTSAEPAAHASAWRCSPASAWTTRAARGHPRLSRPMRAADPERSSSSDAPPATRRARPRPAGASSGASGSQAQRPPPRPTRFAGCRRPALPRTEPAATRARAQPRKFPHD